MFLIETRLKSDEVQSIKFKSGFDFCRIVYCKGYGKERARGLILFRKEKLQFKIDSYSLDHIRGSVVDDTNNRKWFFSGI